jgi:two-component system, response regulator
MSDFEEVEILLAEDSDTDGEMTLRALRKKGIANNVTWVKDGESALDFIYYRGSYAERANGHPKVILLDLKMPRVDGIDVLRQIKGDPTTKTIPVVVLTSSAQDRDLVDSYQLGVNSYIVKPVDFDQFFEVISNLGFYWAVMNKVPPSNHG